MKPLHVPIALLLSVYAVHSNGAPSTDTQFCAAIRSGSATSSIIGPDYNRDGVWRSNEFDFDRDAKPDEFTLTCPGGHGPIAADPCELEIKLANGKIFRKTASWIGIYVYERRAYITTAEPLNEKGEKIRLTVFGGRAKRIEKICEAIQKNRN